MFNCKIIYLFILIYVISTGCNKIIYLNEDLRKSKENITFIRSGPRVIMKSIDSLPTNEKIGNRNNDWGGGKFQLSFKCGDFYALSAGQHRIELIYYGLYTHINPPYSYYKKTPQGLFGPFYRNDPSSIALDMISFNSKTITYNFIPGHKYEARVYLTIDHNMPFFLPDLPDYIAPYDTNIIINPALANYPIPHANDVRLTHFNWDICIVDLGSSEDDCEKSFVDGILNAEDKYKSDYTLMLLSTLDKKEVENIYEITSLHKAARGGGRDLVHALILRGFDINARTEVGMTPLHLAAGNGHSDIVNMLIANDAEVNVKNDMKATPLFYAAGNGHVKTVSILLDHGADIDAKQSTDWTALHHAAHGGHDETVSVLVTHGTDLDAKSDIGLTPLIIAVNEGHPSTAKILINAGADVDKRDNEGWAPLHYAALNAMPDEIEELLAAGASPCLPNKRFCTPLHNAALTGDTTCMRLLIDAGCDVNSKMKNGWTPLHMAALNARPDAIQLLLDRGADVNARSVDGETPLFLANRKGNVICIHTLEAHGGVE